MSEKKSLGKGRMMLLIISRALKKGVAPEEVEETLGRRGLFQALDGKLGTEEIQKKLKAKDPGNLARFFIKETDMIPYGDEIYVLSSQWEKI